MRREIEGEEEAQMWAVGWLKASDEELKRTAVCAKHHLRGIHDGYLRVSGRAPDGLVWEPGRRARLQPDMDRG